MKRPIVLAAVLALAAAVAPGSYAATETPELVHQNWSFEGPFGTFDRAALQRGYQVYKEVCSTCHSMKYMHFRDLGPGGPGGGIGLSTAQVRALAAQYQISDGPNDQGEMFERPGKPSDAFKAPFPNEEAAKVANGGAVPPDLSIVEKGRKGGADYIFGILTGFTQPPSGFKVPNGLYYNAQFPGHLIHMPPPLSEGAVSFSDGTPSTVPQMAHDVATFLTWASDPNMEERKSSGLKVIAFLVVFTGVMYAAKRRVWSDVH
jgi:ubiquinol-cytochrome c reductase cytochrome c1 subunit